LPGRSSQPSRRKRLIASVARIQIHNYTQSDAQASGSGQFVEQRAVVRLAKYPPIGNRDISGQGPHTGYKSYGARHATEYAPWANENIIICPSIEPLEGLDNVEEIVRAKGST
jgi:hypothetical protein